MPDIQSANRSTSIMASYTNFKYSIRASETTGERSFFIINIFRGGEGHCKERRSPSRDPIYFHVNIWPKVQEKCF